MIINVVYCPFYEKIICSQEEYDPEDPANPCTNYPTEEFSSYADCDDQFVKRYLPPDLKPFWAVDNISEATNRYSINTRSYYNLLLGKRTQCSSLSSCLQMTCSPALLYPTVSFPASEPRSLSRTRPNVVPSVQ